MSAHGDGPLPAHHANCFGCGPDNAAGLRMRLRLEEARARAEMTFDRRHEGAPGFVHGGVVAAALDDLFGGVLMLLERPGVTARLVVDFRAPALLGRELALAAWCERTEGSKLHLRGTMHDGDVHVADAEALFLEVDIAHFAKSGAALPPEWHRWGVRRR